MCLFVSVTGVTDWFCCEFRQISLGLIRHCCVSISLLCFWSFSLHTVLQTSYVFSWVNFTFLIIFAYINLVYLMFNIHACIKVIKRHSCLHAKVSLLNSAYWEPIRNVWTAFPSQRPSPDPNNVEEERVTITHFSEMLDIVVWSQALGKTSQ